ncbi:MAG: ATP-binding protein [Desulfosarcinaceae bacterium]|nr:ATP-binding protein [Desulfosarcinaceae bacterium]
MAARVSLGTRIKNTSLKNKIFLATTAVILLISVLIALFTRWVLISSLTSELKLRGLGIATSIAESSRGAILTADRPQLTSLIFDAMLGERRYLLDYVFVQDKKGAVLAHTFTHPFPVRLAHANPLDPTAGTEGAIRLLRHRNRDIYDIAVPVREGIYPIGTVHVGLYKEHIDRLVSKLRSTFLGFLSAVTIIFFAVSHWLSRYISRPLSRLTQASDEISRGNFEMAIAPAPSGTSPLGKGQQASLRSNDEVRLLADSFTHMTAHIRHSQAQLRESELKYRSLFTGGPNPILVLDRRDHTIIDANPSTEEVYGYTREELIGKAIDRLGPFEMKADLLRTAEPKPVLVSAKVAYQRKNGTALHVNVHACPAHYGERPALIVATTDITDMVEKDNQLIQFSKLKTLGEMSAGIAHELNQPLNAIKMGSEYLEMMTERAEMMTREDLATVGGEVSRQVDRATEIIGRLRDFGRKTDFTRERVCLNDPIRSVLKIVAPQLELQNINLVLDLAPDLPSVGAHHNRIEQVIFNLLTNARDAINQKTAGAAEGDVAREIEIRSIAQDGHAVVTVADTGVGIPADVQAQIFEAFFTTKEMGEGMGLGLSISSGIVEDYRGALRVESTPGQGTTFRLSFPLARRENLPSDMA